MSFTKLLKWAFAGCVIISTLSCTEKLETGTVLKDFTGIAGVDPLSPTAVRVYWNLHDRYKNYKVYNNVSSTALAETSRGDVIIRDLSPGTSYTFKVVATDGSLSVGGNKEITASTLTPFTGVDKVIKDSDGNLILSWNYAAKVSEYQIFYAKYEDPTAANTSNWTNVSYTSIDTKYTFRGLEGSTRYHFVVQVKYLDDTYEHPTKSVSIFTNSTFPTPAYSLSPISIGALPFVNVTPVVNSTYKNDNYTSRMYLGTTPVSDPLIGAGTIVFSPGSNITNGKLDNLSLQVSYSEAGKTETLIFDKLSTYIKGILGLKESPPIKSLDSGISFLG
ncbi:MAG: fibronectin type III domain-containing protein, partial [Bdellovibrio sp.]|nr:fibronectin type III domain-containing protein [Bdellovibrio sp.]